MASHEQPEKTPSAPQPVIQRRAQQPSAPGKSSRAARVAARPGVAVQRKSAGTASLPTREAAAENSADFEAMTDAALRGTPLATPAPVQAKAAGQVVQRSGDEEAQPAQEEPPTTRVSNHISDPPYGWTSTYDVQVTDAEVRVTIKIRLAPQAGVTEENVADVQERARASFREKFDNQFVFTDGETEFAVRTDVQFVESGEHAVVNLHAGNGRSNLSNWSVERPSETFAHELGHQLGLLDEYVDASATNRSTADAAGVHTDHSMMGNIHAEGRDEAALRQRHGETIAGHVNAATGREFTVRRR